MAFIEGIKHFIERARPKYTKDTGFAWLVLFLSFLSNFVHNGFSVGVIGNLTVAHKERFSISLKESGIIGSVHMGAFFMLNPLASILVKKTSCRITQLLGGACLIGGIGLSSIANQIWQTYLLYGVLAAFGTSCTYAASAEILLYHFQKYKHMAFPIAAFGAQVGVMVWPIVSEKLISVLGYSTAMGLMAISHIFHLIGGLFFIEPKQENAVESNDDKQSKQGDIETGYTNKVVELSQDDISVTKKPEILREDSTAKLTSLSSDHMKNITSTLLTDIRTLFSSVKVWAIAVNQFLWNLNVIPFLILLRDYMQDKLDIDGEAAAVGYTIIGIAKMIGCIVVVAMNRFKYNRMVTHLLCSLVYGVLTIAISFSVNTTMFYTLSGVWGLAQGFHISNILPVTIDICGTRYMVLLSGFTMMSGGMAAVLGTTLCGYLAEIFGGQYALIAAGCAGVLASCIFFPVAVSHCKNQTQEQN